MGVVANGVFNGISQVDRIVGPLHTLVVFIDIHCFSHEKAPHSIVIMVQFFSVAHELMVQVPDSFFKTLVLILHTEFTFVSREVWDISHGFASTRHVMMRYMLQGYIDVTKVSDVCVCVCLVCVCVCIALYWPCAGLHGGNNVQRSPWQRISSVHSLRQHWWAFGWSQGWTQGGVWPVSSGCMQLIIFINHEYVVMCCSPWFHRCISDVVIVWIGWGR